MAISFINVGAAQANNSSPLSPAIPTNTAAGDLMLLFCFQASAAAITFTPPAGGGWTSIARNSNATRAATLEVFAKTAVGGDTAPSTACSSAASGWITAIATYRGVNNVVIEDVADVASDAAAQQTFQPTGITLSTANDMVLSTVGTKDDNTLTLSVANGFTARMSGASYQGTTGNGSDYSLGMAEQLFASSGAKTNPTWNESANGNDAWVAETIALLAAVPQAPQPTTLALTFSGATPTVTVTNNVLVQPGTLALTFTGATPTVSTPVQASPDALAMTLAFATPAVSTPVQVSPPSLGLTWVGTVPDVNAACHLQPSALDMVLSFATPTVSTPVQISPTALTLAFTGAVPDVNVSTNANVQVTPDLLALAWTGATPTVAVSDNIIVTPGVLALNLALATPSVAVSEHKLVVPTALALALNFATPSVVAINPQLVTPGPLGLTWTGGVPLVGVQPVGRARAGGRPARLPHDAARVVGLAAALRLRPETDRRSMRKRQLEEDWLLGLITYQQYREAL